MIHRLISRPDDAIIIILSLRVKLFCLGIGKFFPILCQPSFLCFWCPPGAGDHGFGHIDHMHCRKRQVPTGALQVIGDGCGTTQQIGSMDHAPSLLMLRFTSKKRAPRPHALKPPVQVVQRSLGGGGALGRGEGGVDLHVGQFVGRLLGHGDGKLRDRFRSVSSS